MKFHGKCHGIPRNLMEFHGIFNGIFMEFSMEFSMEFH
jgi:hypothetical protein